jgi:hypothetical protein
MKRPARLGGTTKQVVWHTRAMAWSATRPRCPLHADSTEHPKCQRPGCAEARKGAKRGEPTVPERRTLSLVRQRFLGARRERRRPMREGDGRPGFTDIAAAPLPRATLSHAGASRPQALPCSRLPAWTSAERVARVGGRRLRRMRAALFAESPLCVLCLAMTQRSSRSRSFVTTSSRSRKVAPTMAPTLRRSASRARMPRRAARPHEDDSVHGEPRCELEAAASVSATEFYAHYKGRLTGKGSAIVLAVEPRISIGIIASGNFYLQPSLPEVDPVNFAPRVKIPVLMLNGRLDFSTRHPCRRSQCSSSWGRLLNTSSGSCMRRPTLFRGTP